MCEDLKCVRSLITQIEHGKMNSAFERLQELVTRDTGRTVLIMRFRALLEATKASSSGNAVNLLMRNDFKYTSTIISHIERCIGRGNTGIAAAISVSAKTAIWVEIQNQFDSVPQVHILIQICRHLKRGKMF